MKTKADILKINGFTHFGGGQYERDDGMRLLREDGKFLIVWGTGEVYYAENDYEAIGYMAIYGIINILF